MSNRISIFTFRYKKFLEALKWIAWKRNQLDWDESLRAKFEEREMRPVDEMWGALGEDEKDEFLKGEKQWEIGSNCLKAESS